jgi:hypothetical protein
VIGTTVRDRHDTIAFTHHPSALSAKISAKLVSRAERYYTALLLCALSPTISNASGSNHLRSFKTRLGGQIKKRTGKAMRSGVQRMLNA